MDVFEAVLLGGRILETKCSRALRTASSAPRSPGITESMRNLAAHIAWIRVVHAGFITTSGWIKTALRSGWVNDASLETKAVNLRFTSRLFCEKLDTLSKTIVRKGPKLGVSLRSAVYRKVSDILGDISSSEP